MSSTIKVLFLVTSFSVIACKQEKKVNNWREDHTTEIRNFDLSRSTVDDLSKLLNEAAEKGSIRVKFPTGEWNYYCDHCAELPTKEKWAKFEFTADDISEKSIENWIDKNQIKGVHIQINPNLLAEKFFILEKILRGHGIIYWVDYEENRGREVIVLRETDGTPRATDTDSEVEQAVPPNGP